MLSVLIRHHFLVIIHAQYSVVEEVELVADTEALVAPLTGEALEVIDVVTCSHNHLEGWNRLTTYRTEPSITE